MPVSPPVIKTTGEGIVLHAQDHAKNVGLEHRGKTFRGLVRDRTDLAFGAALLTATSIRPKRATVLSTMARTSSSFRRSALMNSASDSEAQAYIAAFRGGLQKLGWTEGRNVGIDTRWATPADAESMQRFAKELVALQPDLILSNTTPTTAAAAATNPHHPHRFRDGCRSGRQWLRRELPAARRQRHRFRRKRELARG
jgi:hypothetical protein